MRIQELFGAFRGVTMICFSQPLRVKSKPRLRFGKNKIKAFKVRFQEMLCLLQPQFDSSPTLYKSRAMGSLWGKRAEIYQFG